MLKDFGSSVAQRGKFDARAYKCTFLGFKTGVKGYVAYDIHTKEIIISRHAIFHECIFPCNSSQFPPCFILPQSKWEYISQTASAKNSMPLEICEISAPIPAIDSDPDITSEQLHKFTVLSDPATPVLFQLPSMIVT
jgi:hypothetical protein